jgi:hypothetical protein
VKFSTQVHSQHAFVAPQVVKISQIILKIYIYIWYEQLCANNNWVKIQVRTFLVSKCYNGVYMLLSKNIVT